MESNTGAPFVRRTPVNEANRIFTIRTQAAPRAAPTPPTLYFFIFLLDRREKKECGCRGCGSGKITLSEEEAENRRKKNGSTWGLSSKGTLLGNRLNHGFHASVVPPDLARTTIRPAGIIGEHSDSLGIQTRSDAGHRWCLIGLSTVAGGWVPPIGVTVMISDARDQREMVRNRTAMAATGSSRAVADGQKTGTRTRFTVADSPMS